MRPCPLLYEHAYKLVPGRHGPCPVAAAGPAVPSPARRALGRLPALFNARA